MSNRFAQMGQVTKVLIGANVLVFLADLASGGAVQNMLALGAPTVFSEPWTVVTYGFAHSGWIHIALNLYSVWIFGEALERLLGSNRFAILYFGSLIVGGLAFVLTSDGYVVGASGAVFGLMAAYFVIMRAFRQNTSSMLVLIILNVVIGFTNPGIAISTHIGGLLAGGAIAWYYTQARR